MYTASVGQYGNQERKARRESVLLVQMRSVVFGIVATDLCRKQSMIFDFGPSQRTTAAVSFAPVYLYRGNKPQKYLRGQHTPTPPRTC